MRTLTQICYAVRRNQPVEPDELRYAVAAYDVLLAKLNVGQDPQQMAAFFEAAESCPKAYIGWENDPENPEAVKWHEDHIDIEPIIAGARKLLQESGDL